jgi:hypothetical protein
MDTASAAMHAAVTRLPTGPLRLDRLIRASAVHSMTDDWLRLWGTSRPVQSRWPR